MYTHTCIYLCQPWIHLSIASPFYCCCYSCCYKSNLCLELKLKTSLRSSAEDWWEVRGLSPSHSVRFGSARPSRSWFVHLLLLSVEISREGWKMGTRCEVSGSHPRPALVAWWLHKGASALWFQLVKFSSEIPSRKCFEQSFHSSLKGQGCFPQWKRWQPWASCDKVTYSCK